MEGRTASDVARKAGIPIQTLHGYLKGAIPSADRALALADELGVEYRWLIAGLGPQVASRSIADEGVALPRFDLHKFDEYGKGAPVEDVHVPRWLLSSIKQTTGLWLCEMPNDALPSIAAEGEMIVCRDADFPLQDRRIYIFSIDGRVIVRKLSVRPEGLQLTSEGDDDTILIKPEETDNVVPIGRVLASISLHQV